MRVKILFLREEECLGWEFNPYGHDIQRLIREACDRQRVKPRDS